MSYEFLEADQEQFSSLGSAMTVVGTAYLVLGLVNLVNGGLIVVKVGIAAAVSHFAHAGFFLFVGQHVKSAGHAFSKIATERTSDIAYLMRAIEDLSKVFGMQKNIILALIAAVVLGTIFVYFG